MDSKINISIHKAKELDKKDPLRQYRQEFYINKDRIYLDGNSLGLLSKPAEESVMKLLSSWRDYGIDGWTEGEHPWFYLSESLSKMIAPLLGAKKEEVIVTGSTTTNLHQLVATFFHPKDNKSKILTDELAFPTDVYALQSQIQLGGLDSSSHLVKVPSQDGHTLMEEDIIERMTDEIALIVLPSILYRSGQILNIKKLTEEAHKRNIVIGFDLCHSIGSIPHNLSEWEVDFAFWCNYKHLNGGPGSVGGLYVNERHFGKRPGLAGWFSSRKDKQFDMDHELTQEVHAGAFQMGTPHVLSLAPLIGSLSMFDKVGINMIREKSLKLTSYMLQLLDVELKEHGFIVRNPLEEDKRGGHILVEHPEAARICKALKSNGIIPDFRSPNAIRIAPVALYNSFEEVWLTVQKLKTIMEDREYKKFENKRGVIA